MKKLLIISAIVGIVALTSNQSNAQVSLNVNIGTQPTWVPAGYQDVNYYYLPEVNSYYYVPQRQFVYLHGNSWKRSKYLPARYRGYDLHRSKKVVVYGNNPYNHYNTHRARYSTVRYVSRPAYYNQRTVRYSAPRNYRAYNNNRYDNRNHDRNVNSSLFSRGHREKHGRH